MGGCCSCFSSASRVKAMCSSSQAGTNSKNVSKGFDFCASENMFSYTSMPPTPPNEGVSVPPTPPSEAEVLQSSNFKIFSFNELKTATKNFRPDSIVGEGGFGAVFKGWVDKRTLTPTRSGRGMVVAVKRLKHDGGQGHKEWLAEINYLGRLRHPNVVRLLGYCLEEEHRLLVYEFMARGSLEDNLFSNGYQVLPWNSRMTIALGAAKGLACLHNAEAKVIYRDFKCANILLDSDYNAKVSDFGLARDAPSGDSSHVSTRVMGTRGYAAPEYISTGRLTTRSDVFSFGVVLLELISGRRTIDKEQPFGEHNLVEWAMPYLGNMQKFWRVLDTRLRGQYSPKEAWMAASLAFQCLNHEAKLRPSMEEVVRILEMLQQGEKDTKSCEIEFEERREEVMSWKNESSYPKPSKTLLYT